MSRTAISTQAEASEARAIAPDLAPVVSVGLMNAPVPEPLARVQRVQRRIRLAAAVTITMVMVWAFWPITPSSVVEPSPAGKGQSQPEAPAIASVPPLNAAAFDAPLWVIAATPPAQATATPPPPPPPPPPLRLQLLGITRDESQPTPVYRAAVYDPDSDRIIVVNSGDTVGGRVVQSIASDRIAFALGAQVKTLLLRADQSPTQAKGGGGVQ
jgi:hypothetical protein